MNRIMLSLLLVLTVVAAQEDPIRPGDVIQVNVIEDADVKYDGEVSAAGLIQVPYLGRFAIAGLAEAEAAEALRAKLENNLYVKATVSVTIIKRAPGYVYIYGAVRSPGKVDLPVVGDLVLLQALAEVNGVSTWAAPESAYVLRLEGGGERIKMPVDILKAFENMGGPENLALRTFDMVFVPSRIGFDSVLSSEAVEVVVTGQVSKPGLVTFAPGEQRTFMRAIFKAGNFTSAARTSAVRLFHREKDGSKGVKLVNVQRMLKSGALEDDFELDAGDMIVVDEDEAIVVMGQVTKPGLVEFAVGEQHTVLRAIFKAGNFTPEAKKDAVRLVRRDENGAPVVQIIDAAKMMMEGIKGVDVSLMPGDMIIVDEEEAIVVTGQVKIPGPVKFAPGEQRTFMRAIFKAGNFTPSASTDTVRLIRRAADGSRDVTLIDAAAMMEKGTVQDDITLQSGDMIIVSESLGVVVTGQVNEPGLITFAPGEQQTFMRAIFRAGNFTRYAKTAEVRVISMQNGRRVVKEVDADRIITKGFIEDDFVLSPGDMIIVDMKRVSF